MKKGIFIAMAALGLALFAVPEAHGVDGQSLQLRFAGSNFITSSTDEGRPTPLGQVSTSLQNGIVKGGGSAVFSAQTIVEEAGQDDRCGSLPGAALSTTTVLTYNDGSILSLTTDDEVSFFCFDPISGVFFVDFAGTVTGGVGRFEGASGSWQGTAQAQSSRVTADITVDLD
ncbi:MAG: hypothetical protein OEM15_13775 [Myxococcales bacterium]|nr:hypothetical protein [Myxococcales bacterium]MDH3486264.1 hypothetical protein [Myxococcales bacterium]